MMPTGAPPPPLPTAVPDARETGLTPEQEIRARAAHVAATLLADIIGRLRADELTDKVCRAMVIQALRIADQAAAYIRDGSRP